MNEKDAGAHIPEKITIDRWLDEEENAHATASENNENNAIGTTTTRTDPQKTLVVYSGPTSMDRLQDKNGMYFDNMNYFLEHGISCYDDDPTSSNNIDDELAEPIIVNYAFVLTQEVADYYDKRSDMQFVKPSQKKTQTKEESFAQDESMLPIKPHLAGFNPPTKALTLENRLNLSEDNVMFVVLDVETTGLDDKVSHVIQLACKVLGSDDDNDLFSEYILPPIDCIPKKIQELTGITDQFLRQGGYDKALNKEVGTAREFRQVYHDFQDFCIDRAQGRSIVFVAHNAKFDIRMINGELRRWRFSDDTDSAPVLGDLFASSLDTLQLFRTSKFYSKSFPRPTSFSLGTLHEHVLEESISNSHNAVGDVLALERLLQSDIFQGWQSLATRIQEPIPTIKVRS